MDKRLNNLLLVAACGNLLCWIGDVLLSVFPGAETVSGLSLSPAWADAPLWRFSLSGVLGSIAMMAVLCGFYVLYRMLKSETPKAATLVMLACAVLFICVVRGKTGLPRWAAVFNIFVIMTVLSCLRPIVTIPGTMNLGGMGMFLGIYLCGNHLKRPVVHHDDL